MSSWVDLEDQIVEIADQLAEASGASREEIVDLAVRNLAAMCPRRRGGDDEMSKLRDRSRFAPLTSAEREQQRDFRDAVDDVIAWLLDAKDELRDWRSAGGANYCLAGAREALALVPDARTALLDPQSGQKGDDDERV